MEASEPVAIDLTDEERYLLCRGLLDWGGPARCTDDLARVMGFKDVDDLYDEGRRLVQALKSESALSPNDWWRVEVATEFVFASDSYGSGVDFSITSGLTDEECVALLRSVQRKLGKVLMNSTLSPRGRKPGA